MKELTIEQKAKKYDKALERAKIYNTDNTKQIVKDLVTYLFPELKESEDEPSKNWILEYLYDGLRRSDEQFKDEFKAAIAWLEKQGNIDKASYEIAEKENNENEETNAPTSYGKYVDECLSDAAKHFFSEGKDKYSVADLFYAGVKCGQSWIEKQEEQKPFNYESANIQQKDFAPKIEPKFKVGDWVVNKLGVSWHIDSFDKKNYQVSDGKGNYNYFPISKQDEMRLWTIEDAKDGDVLSGWKNTCLFRKKMKDDSAIWVDAYCGIDIEGVFQVNDKNECWCLACDCIPATKEQRDILFKAMVDAGYEFDFDKKELKKIEQQDLELRK